MKYIHLFLCLILLMLVSGCKTKKAVMQPKVEITHIDTTKAVVDSQATSKIIADSVAIDDSLSISYIFNFIDSGGRMSINPDGTTAFSGIHTLRIIDNSKHNYRSRYNAADSSNKLHTDKANGIRADSVKIPPQPQSRATKVQKAISRISTRLVILIAVAVLIWAAFLYLKRKK